MRGNDHRRGETSNKRRCWPTILATVCVALAAVDPAKAQAAATSDATAAASVVAPHVLGARIFFIPYQPPAGPPGNDVESVELCISRDAGSNWHSLQRADPHVRGFTYHAPADGQYYFAVRLHRPGKANVEAYESLIPQLHVKIDTAKPTVRLSAALDSAGRIVFQYDVRDESQLLRSSVRLEAQADDGPWSEIALQQIHGIEHGWLYGSGRWEPPPQSREVRIRMAVSDEADNVATAVTQTALTGPSLFAGRDRELRQSPAPDRRGPRQATIAENFGTPTNPSVGGSIEWPAPVQGESPSRPRTIIGPIAQGAAVGQGRSIAPNSRIDVPPPDNSYANLHDDRRRGTPARFAAGNYRSNSDPIDAADASKANVDGSPRLTAPPLVASAPTAQGHAPPSSDNRRQAVSMLDDQQAARLVNSRTFDIEYDVESVGPWGIAKIEIWGTTDGGQSWSTFGVDADHRSPIRVATPSSGTYGFRIVVDGANSPPSPAPGPGDPPELYVTVDLSDPAVRLISAGCVHSQGATELHIQWNAEDENLEARPIGLFYSSYPQGPWTPIATGLANTGQYAWRLERHLPDRFYLRVEARDRAGNVAAYQSAAPVVLDRPQPTGRLRDVRQVEQ